VVYFGGFFAKLGHFAGFVYKLFFGRNSEAVMGRGRGRGHNMINTGMKITNCMHVRGFVLKLEFSRGFLYTNINFAGRNCEAAMAREGGPGERL
jgi:hypothetical protein